MLRNAIKNWTPGFIWRFAQNLRRKHATAGFKSCVTTHEYGGFPLKVSLEDPLAKGWYDSDWTMPTEVELLRRGKLRTRARVFDIGAHQAIVAMILARLVGPDGFVLAVEADPHSAAVAERNRALNNVDQLKVLHAAGSAQSGHINFSCNGFVAEASSKDSVTSVEAFALDDLAEKYGVPDVLFVDVEGFEAEVLKGARAVLKSRPDCYIEVHVGLGLERAGGSVEEVLSFFSEDHYSLLIGEPHAVQFAPLDRASPILKKHFYLVALSK